MATGRLTPHAPLPPVEPPGGLAREIAAAISCGLDRGQLRIVIAYRAQAAVLGGSLLDVEILTALRHVELDRFPIPAAPRPGGLAC